MERPPFILGILGRLALLGAALFAILPALGHAGFDTETSVNLRADRMDVVIRMMPTQLLTLLGNDAPPVLDTQGYNDSVPLLKKRAGGLYEVFAGDAPLPAGTVEVSVEGDGYIAVKIAYPPPSKWPVSFIAKFPDDFGPEFVGRISAFDLSASPPPTDPPPIAGAVQIGQNAAFEIPEPKAAPPKVVAPADSPKTAPPPASRQPSARDFVKLGVEHILTGYDHLLFLVALLVSCRRPGPMLGIITSFTLAHSITLALSALDLVRISSHVVEPLIAASIVIVGLENLFAGEETGARQPMRIAGRTLAFSWPRRWQLAFAFGLVHGFGFASALREIGLGANGSSIVGPILSFNVGVELGQLAVAAVAMPIFLLSRRVPRVGPWVVPGVSLLVVLAGGYWFLERTFL